MYNLVKSELYRLFKMRSVWLWEIFSAVIVYSIITYIEIKAFGSSSWNTAVNFYNTAASLLIALQSGFVVLAASIFTAIYVNGDNKHGYIRNIAGRICFKGKLFVAKLPSIMVINIIMFVVNYIGSFMLNVLARNNFSVLLTKMLAESILLQFILHYAFECFIAMITVFTRSTAIPCVFAVLIVFGDVHIKEFTVMYNIRHPEMSRAWSEPSVIFAIAVGYIVISSVLSVVIMNKRDVK